MPLEAFFPDRGERTADVIAVCERCPVRVDCLDDALRTHTSCGIRGGFSLAHTKSRRRASQWLANALKARHDRADTAVAS